jgi:glycerol kinase
MFFLAVDQSTAATKVILFDRTLDFVDQESLPHKQIYPAPGWVEHNPEEIFQNLIASISRLLARHEDKQDKIIQLSLTNQRETFVIFDAATGEPLYNAIVWQCRRGEKICQSLSHSEQMIHTKTGLKLDTYFPASKLLWLLREKPEIGQKLADGSALFGTIDTYLLYRLTNGKCYATDHTNASRTLFYDINTLNWDKPLQDIFQIKLSRLPDIKESCSHFSETDLGGMLNTPIPIAGVMGDSQAALFAQRCFQPGAAKVTFGSGSSILMNIGETVVLSEKGMVTSLAWVYHGTPTYAFEGITNFTGSIITWLRDQLTLINSVDETEALARSIPDTDGVYLVPSFVGFSAPYWRPNAKAGVIGLTPSSTKAHLVRAALESIAYLLTGVLHQLANESDAELKTISADGGATQNRFLMQFMADISRLSVKVSSIPVLSALGATMFGALGTNIFENFAELEQMPFNYEIFTPQMSDEQAEGLYQGWKNAVSKILYEREENENS